MQITLNGEPYPLHSINTVAELVTSLDMDPMKIAVEQNEMVVPRNQHAQQPLSDGDIIEIIQFVGGG